MRAGNRGWRHRQSAWKHKKAKKTGVLVLHRNSCHSIEENDGRQLRSRYGKGDRQSWGGGKVQNGGVQRENGLDHVGRKAKTKKGNRTQVGKWL